MTKDWIARARDVVAIEIAGLLAVAESFDSSFSQAVEAIAACTGRVVVTGIGKSGLVGRKIAATLSSIGKPAFFLHPVEGAHGDLGSVSANDVVIAISYSGKSVELNAILPAVRNIGASIIALTSGEFSPLAQMSDIVINTTVPKEACPMNMIPTASTTATLAVGDALAVCLIETTSFTSTDFKKFHPAGNLGQRLQLSVADIMHTDNIPVALFDVTIFEALQGLEKGKLGAVLLVSKENVLQGILTDGDIRRLVFLNKLDVNQPVHTVMTKSPRHATPLQSAAELMDLMEQKAITVLPVVDTNNSVIGIVHLHDILGKGTISFTD